MSHAETKSQNIAQLQYGVHDGRDISAADFLYDYIDSGFAQCNKGFVASR